MPDVSAPTAILSVPLVGILNSKASEEVRFHLSRESKRKIYSATITAVVVVLSLGQAHAGFLAILLVLPFAFWLGWSAWVIVRQPYARLAQFICLLVWCIAIALVVAAQYVRHVTTRADADRIAAKIDRFHVDNGYCAPTLEAAGYRLGEVEDSLGPNVSYSCVDRRPKFSYVVTFTILDTYEYDFDRNKWVYMSWAKKKPYREFYQPGSGMAAPSPAAPSPPPSSPLAPRRTP